MNPFVQADGFMELGMFTDAWNALDELPPVMVSPASRLVVLEDAAFDDIWVSL